MNSRDVHRSRRPGSEHPAASRSGPFSRANLHELGAPSGYPGPSSRSTARAAPSRNRQRGHRPAGESAGMRAAQSGQVLTARSSQVPSIQSDLTNGPGFLVGTNMRQGYRAVPGFNPPGRRKGFGFRLRPAPRRRRSRRSPRVAAGRSGAAGDGRRRERSLRSYPAARRSPQ